MTRVKRKFSWRLAMPGAMLGAMLAATGCGGVRLSRLAPPGIIKYEEIAGDQPPNPAIEERIETRVVNQKAPFPILSQTPSPADRPARTTTAEREAQAAELIAARDALEAGLAADREASEAERADDPPEEPVSGEETAPPARETQEPPIDEK